MDRRFFCLTFILGVLAIISCADRTAQCKIKWLFGIPCDDVNGKLVNQIQSWEIRQSCADAGETCSYELLSSAPYLIQSSTHVPSIKEVTGEAVSEFSKDPDDNSTNYCSLQNLMDGSSLIDAEGYKQFSNKWICPGFDSANCTM
ncbi:hypothetical protein OJAV_G00170600 [Oryzias javanicus]|uniref:Uncharacterized protein n=1 Tax=Oryzias javanicus TaxID=123683 RepID=A0A437CGI5_ORYJA|nr:hypothetical protein OJAV_G00170600 [Oryzias javanicus]